MWGEKAETVFEAELVEHVTAGTWLKAIVDVLTQSNPDTPGFDLNVKSRASGEVVYSVELSAGIAAEEGLRAIETDLKSLGLEEFCEKYGILVPEERVSRAPPSSRLQRTAGSRYEQAMKTFGSNPKGFAKPEEAAVASFPSSALARVVRVEPQGPDRVDVIVDTDPSHLMRVHCERHGDSWYEAGDIVE